MFSGIVEEVGTIESINAPGPVASMRISAASVLHDSDPLGVSDSISVNGACLTATEVGDSTFCVDVTPETLSKTTLSQLKAGGRVNLERALKYGDRVGGHLVQGHVEGIGVVADVQQDGDAKLVRVSATADIIGYTIEKGFIALDGVSLTCFDCEGGGFTFALIPFTATHTTLGEAEVGTKLNIETDMFAKYVERQARLIHSQT